jgi:hypothetical protein
MEEFADERCSVIYIRSDLGARWSQLYTTSTVPKAASSTGAVISSDELILQNVRILLDEHVGDFSEGEPFSCALDARIAIAVTKPSQCLSVHRLSIVGIDQMRKHQNETS